MPDIEIFENIKSRVLDKLRVGLSGNLHYHGIRHTLDVIEQSERIAKEEKVNNEDMLLLKLAGLYHDSGFLVTYMGHEAAGCRFAKEDLPMEGFSEEQINIICGLIMATKLPQSPVTKLEEIICDADLDYLGRDDFFEISNSLFLEFKERNFVSNEQEWNKRQLDFFKQHHYFTVTNTKLREPQKLKHLSMIEAMG